MVTWLQIIHQRDEGKDHANTHLDICLFDFKSQIQKSSWLLSQKEFWKSQTINLDGTPLFSWYVLLHFSQNKYFVYLLTNDLVITWKFNFQYIWNIIEHHEKHVLFTELYSWQSALTLLYSFIYLVIKDILSSIFITRPTAFIVNLVGFLNYRAALIWNILSQTTTSHHLGVLETNAWR